MVFCYDIPSKLLGWPKSLFGFFHKRLWKNPNKLFGQPNNITTIFKLISLDYSDFQSLDGAQSF